MTTTIDIPDDLLQRVLEASGASSPQEAILKAIEGYVARHDQRSLIPLLGTFGDEFYPPGELEKSREDDRKP